MYKRQVCDYVRELGGKPFLTDCNTLYVGGRANALGHLDSAMRNVYTPMTTDAQCIIADGLNGDDYDLVSIRGGKYLRAAKIGRAIMDADKMCIRDSSGPALACRPFCMSSSA